MPTFPLSYPVHKRQLKQHSSSAKMAEVLVVLAAIQRHCQWNINELTLTTELSQLRDVTVRLRCWRGGSGRTWLPFHGGSRRSWTSRWRGWRCSERSRCRRRDDCTARRRATWRMQVRMSTRTRQWMSCQQSWLSWLIDWLTDQSTELRINISHKDINKSFWRRSSQRRSRG